MSVGSISSNTWTSPYAPRSVLGSACGDFAPPATEAGNTASATSISSTGTTNPFQQLAADIQAMLVQAQSGTAAPAASTAATSAATATGGTTAVSPEQQLATDVQAMLAQLQSGQAGNGTTAQTATAGQEGVGEVHPHHHHHHHEGGSLPGGDATSSTVASTSTSSGTSMSSSDQAVSQAFAADIAQALQAYASLPSTTAVPGLTA